VLKRYGTSPIPPESDDEKRQGRKEGRRQERRDKSSDRTRKTRPDAAKDAAKDCRCKKDDKDKKKKDDKPVEVKIDLENIGNRILSLPVPARNYVDLEVGKTGVLYLAEGTAGRPPSGEGRPRHPRPLALHQPRSATPTRLLRNIDAFTVSANGEKLLYAKGTIGSSLRRATSSLGSPDSAWQAVEHGRTCRPSSTRAPSGSRCTTKPGASSATSSTTRTPTA
jgi:tricorn protease